MGALLLILVKSGPTPGFAASSVLGGLVFSLGLLLAVGAELFTGNNLLVMAWVAGKISSTQLLRNWGLAYLINFCRRGRLCAPHGQ